MRFLPFDKHGRALFGSEGLADLRQVREQHERDDTDSNTRWSVLFSSFCFVLQCGEVVQYRVDTTAQTCGNFGGRHTLVAAGE